VFSTIYFVVIKHLFDLVMGFMFDYSNAVNIGRTTEW